MERNKSRDVIPDSEALVLISFQHPNATEGILEELENAVAPSVEFLGNGKQQKQQEQSWKQAPAG